MSLNGAAADEPNHNDEPSLGSPTTSSSSLDVDNEEQARKLLKPAPTDEQILALLGTHYSQYSDVKIVRQLDSYDDVNYQVELDGTNYLLKIHNGVESLNYIATSGNNFYANMTSVIQLQTAILELCREHGLPVNEPIRPTPDSSSDATTIPNDKKCPVCVVKLPVVDHGRSCDLVVRLLSWLRGRPMSNVNLLPLESLADAGRFLGRLDKVLDHINEAALRGHTLAKVESNASLVLEQQGADSTASPKAKRARATCSSLDHLRADLGTLQEQATNTVLDVGLLIPANRFHQWDTKHTLQLRKFVTHIPNEKRQGLVTSVIDAFQTQLVDTGVAAQFRTGVIHGDFNDANTLVNEEMAVCGAIDFGDSVCSWRVLDVAIAMAYAMLSTYGKKNRSLSAAAGVLRGYNSIYPLTKLERKHLILLMVCRLACSVTLGAYSYQQNPENKYLLLHSEPAWRALELLWTYCSTARSKIASAVNRLFDQACLYTDSRETVITCYDLVIPDPTVADLLASIRVSSSSNVVPYHSSEPVTKKAKHSSALPAITFVSDQDPNIAQVARLLQPNDANGGLVYSLRFVNKALPRLQGDIMELAQEKCRIAAQHVNGAVITEDTALCFTALHGLPGPYINFFLESCGVDGLHKMIEAYDDKTAYAQTVVCFCIRPGHEPVVFEGRTHGTIVAPRGTVALDWDAIFEPAEGGGKAFAEMKNNERDALSHRGQALVQLREYLNKFVKSSDLC